MSFPKQKPPHNVRVLRDWIRDYAASTDQVVGRITRAISFMLVALALERARSDDGAPSSCSRAGSPWSCDSTCGRG
jgi:hypothetical protein